jgi:hypothetical protein
MSPMSRLVLVRSPFMFIFISISGINEGAGRFVIPVSLDHAGLGVINATIPAINGDEIVPVSLTPYSTAGATQVDESLAWSDDMLPNITVQLLDEVISNHQNFHLVYIEQADVTEDWTAHLGVGRGSPLVNDYGAVDYIKDVSGNACLVVNSTMEWFSHESCAENSLLSLPLNGTPI